MHAVAVRDGEVVAEAGDPRRSSRSCARRRSRSRRCRSSEHGPTWTTASSRSRPPRTSPTPEQLEAVARCSRRAPATEDDLECGAEGEAAGAGSSTTAPASTPGCSPSAARTAGRSRATACPTIHVQQADARRGRGGGGRRRTRSRPAIDGCGVVTFALPLERMAARSRGSSGSTAASGSPPRCARTPS